METIINGFKTNRAFAVTSVLVLCLLLIAIAAPVIAPYDPTHAAMKLSLIHISEPTRPY